MKSASVLTRFAATPLWLLPLAGAILPPVNVSAQNFRVAHRGFIEEAPPYPYAHTSTLLETAPGEITACWVGGPGGRVPEDEIRIARRTEGSGWSAPEIACDEEAAAFNPVLWKDAAGGEVLLFYKAGVSPEAWTGKLRRSRDGGRTWSAPETLPAGLTGPVRAKPIQLADGTLVCGDSVEAWKAWAGWVNITTDLGRTWRRCGPLVHPTEPHGVIQPVIFETGGRPGELRALLRPTLTIGKICTATSADGGLTWSAVSEIDALPNPNSAMDVVTLPDSTVVLCHNDQAEGRNRLSLSVSRDGGATWKKAATLVEEKSGEYSYPAMILDAAGRIHISYTWKRERIGYLVVETD